MPDEVAIIIITGMLVALAWGVLGTIKTVVIKRYEAKHGGDSESLRHELAELTRRMEAFEDNVVIRVQDLEERLDFTERVLAQNRRAGELPDRS